MNRIYGIDPSLTGTGLATDEGTLTLASRPEEEDSVAGRAHRISDLVGRILAHIPDVDYGGCLVVIEGPAYAQQAQSGVHLRAGLWWLLAVRLTQHGHVVVEVSPTTLKKFATGRGNATKPDMRMALFQRAGIDERDDNRVDAWWLRQIGLHLTGHPDAISLPATHTAALAKVNYELHIEEVPF